MLAVVKYKLADSRIMIMSDDNNEFSFFVGKVQIFNWQNKYECVKILLFCTTYS